MKNLLIICFMIFYSFYSLASLNENMAGNQKNIDKSKTLEKPNLGSCSEYSDYYIYKCTPFACSLPVGKYQGIKRTMETKGFEEDKCVHKYVYVIREKKFPSADIRVECKLSELGRREMAALFTQYKNGNTSVYTYPEMNQVLSKECNVGS